VVLGFRAYPRCHEMPPITTHCPQANGYVLFHEDCLQTTRRLSEPSVDLIYVDPPFFSGRSYGTGAHGFDDKWSGLGEYLSWMTPRLIEFRRILKPKGSVYIHCDLHASHYLKVLADSVFGIANFLNQIEWKRQSSHNDVRQGSRHFGRIHDSILLYAASSDYEWNQQYVEYDEEYVRRTYRYVEPETGRRYALGDLTAPGGAAKNNARYEFLGFDRYWRYSRRRMSELLSAGKISHRNARVPRLRRYLDEMHGKPLQDIWSDIKPLSRHELRYPTQKPEELLSRIITTSSNRNQLVYDPFVGSGTSAAVCFKLSRRWIGSEISRHACRITMNRLAALGCKAVLHSDQKPSRLLDDLVCNSSTPEGTSCS